jgi:hypothetical protein
VGRRIARCARASRQKGQTEESRARGHGSASGLCSPVALHPATPARTIKEHFSGKATPALLTGGSGGELPGRRASIQNSPVHLDRRDRCAVSR